MNFPFSLSVASLDFGQSPCCSGMLLLSNRRDGPIEETKKTLSAIAPRPPSSRGESERVTELRGDPHGRADGHKRARAGASGGGAHLEPRATKLSAALFCVSSLAAFRAAREISPPFPSLEPRPLTALAPHGGTSPSWVAGASVHLRRRPPAFDPFLLARRIDDESKTRFHDVASLMPQATGG